MNAAAIIQEAKEWTLSRGEALYCDHAGNVWIGLDGCQPSGSCCIWVHDGIDEADLDWREIEATIAAWIGE